ncbi:MAG: PAS domain S-box protein [bacterium]|nr:PAS domain S-box protein [bacterium]
MEPQSAHKNAPLTGRSFHFNYLQQFLRLTEKEKNVIRHIGTLLSPRLPEIVDKFYDHLISSGITHQFFPDQKTVERLKKAQIQYFLDIFEARFDDYYIEQRRQIGKTHERIGLEPRWYIGAYGLHCETLFPILREALNGDAAAIEEAQLALLKVFFLDMELAMETYIERYSRELVDARKRIEQKLWMEDRLLTFILTEASDAIVGLDEDGRISTWSQGAQRLFGFRTMEIVDKSLRDLIVDPRQLELLRKQASAEGSATVYETEWKTKDGGSIIADANLTMLRDQKGVQIGSTLILRDTTEIRKLAGKLKNMEQIHAMTRITAGVAHEIRTPLGVMALTADLITDRLQTCLDLDDPAEREPIKLELFEMLGDLQKEVDRMNEIVNHYLVLSRIQKPKKSVIEINRYFGEIVEELKERVSRTGVMLEISPCPEDVYVEVDTDQFRRLTLNLFENSQYALGDEGLIRLELDRDGSSAVIRVSDNGRGIPPDRLESVFTAFETNRPGGTGLGLYLVREIVEAHGGRVYIESVVGQGTSVIIQIPVHHHENEMSNHERGRTPTY